MGKNQTISVATSLDTNCHTGRRRCGIVHLQRLNTISIIIITIGDDEDTPSKTFSNRVHCNSVNSRQPHAYVIKPVGLVSTHTNRHTNTIFVLSTSLHLIESVWVLLLIYALTKWNTCSCVGDVYTSTTLLLVVIGLACVCRCMAVCDVRVKTVYFETGNVGTSSSTHNGT